MTPDRSKSDSNIKLTTDYPMFQLSKAFQTLKDSNDSEIRTRAQNRVDQWVATLTNMLNGKVSVGSRTPIAEFPSWVTLEILSGGFATGNALAGGDIQLHEVQIAADLGWGIPDHTDLRIRLNSFFISDPGMSFLKELIKSGNYRVEIPEEGALLIVSWLLENGFQREALDLMDQILPFFETLRFYPRLANNPLPSSACVHKQTVKDTITQLSYLSTPFQISALRESVLIWKPLYHQAIDLILTTFSGNLPNLQDGEIVGGWPFQHFPKSWKNDVTQLLNSYNDQIQNNSICSFPKNPKRNFHKIIETLSKCQFGDSKSLSAREVGMVRAIIAGFLAKYDEPSSKTCQDNYRHQKNCLPIDKKKMALILISRLNKFPFDEGITDLSVLEFPIDSEESDLIQIPIGSPIPASFLEKIKNCYHAPLEELFSQNIISSGDELATIIPQITARSFAEAYPDDSLKYLMIQIYQAFRKRRSLLLLNFEHQVRIEELPWVKVLQPIRPADKSTNEILFEEFQRLVALYIEHFPHRIVANKMLQELDQYSKFIGKEMPIVEELAADIFMGGFSLKFVKAARIAASQMANTLYTYYYSIPYEPYFPRPLTQEELKTLLVEFNELCNIRAASIPSKTDSWVAENGKIIEQAQIITTHNLALVFDVYLLFETLHPQFEEFSQTCFSWICKKLTYKYTNWHAKLKAIKNAAYAWRNMMFYLSFIPQRSLSNFLDWAEETFQSYSVEFQDSFSEVFSGLKDAITEYIELKKLPREKSEIHLFTGKQFLGWQ